MSTLYWSHNSCLSCCGCVSPNGFFFRGFPGAVSPHHLLHGSPVIDTLRNCVSRPVSLVEFSVADICSGCHGCRYFCQLRQGTRRFAFNAIRNLEIHYHCACTQVASRDCPDLHCQFPTERPMNTRTWKRAGPVCPACWTNSNRVVLKPDLHPTSLSRISCVIKNQYGDVAIGQISNGENANDRLAPASNAANREGFLFVEVTVCIAQRPVCAVNCPCIDLSQYVQAANGERQHPRGEVEGLNWEAVRELRP